jgi:hypothetical protein
MERNSNHRAHTDVLNQCLRNHVVEQSINGRLIGSDSDNHAISRNRRSGLADILGPRARPVSAGSLLGSAEVE